MTAAPDIVRLKHFGAAASSSGGVEMYHIAGVTPEAPDVETAFGGNVPLEVFDYGAAERRRVYDALNANASDPAVDFVMLGCPHAALEQLREAAAMLDGRRISGNTRLWIFTSRAVRVEADAAGYTAAIEAAGGVVMTDTCSAFAQAMPPGTRVAALDSAKQAHYLPAILDVQAWFGTTRDCIEAAVTGPLERRGPVMIVLRGRTVVGGRAEGEALVTQMTVPGWGGVNPVKGVITETRHDLRGVELRRQGAGVPRRQGIVGLVGDVSHGAAGRHGAGRAGLQRDDHQGGAGRGGDAGAERDRLSTAIR